MPTEYAKTGSTIKPYAITQEVAAAMGRLVRACAELEDIIGLHLNDLAILNEGQALILMPRMPVSTKLKLAKTFAQVAGKRALDAHNRCFDNDAYTSLMTCRNAVAHGLLLGLTEENKIAFRTVQMVGTDETAVSVNVISYVADDFRKFAGACGSPHPLRGGESEASIIARKTSVARHPSPPQISGDKAAKRSTSAPAEAIR